MPRAKLSIFILVIMIGLLFIPAAPVQAASDEIRVFLDNVQLEFEFYPIVRNDRVLVGMRPVFNAYDADVEWNGDLQKITAHKGTTLMEFYIDNRTYWIDSVAKTADVAPVGFAGHTYVPLRLIAECFKSSVYWNGESNAVFMYSENYEPPTNMWSERELNDSLETANSIYLDQSALPTFTALTDVDYFKLWVHKPGTVNITVKGSNESQLPVFIIYNEISSTALATSTKNAQGVESASLSLEPGIYYIKVNNLGTIVTSDYYTLRAASGR